MLFYLAALFTVALARNVDLPYIALHNPDLFQGDIIGVEDNDVRNAIPNLSARWPNGVVPYIVDYSLMAQSHLISQAMQHIMSVTGSALKFVKRTHESNYIRMFAGDGCYSHVGRTGGAQPLSLGKGCHFVGTIIHELLHACGFYHEQNRSDRDQYLVIHWNNIQQGMESQFALLQPHQNKIFNAFDYNSIMIYGEFAFSKVPNRLPTMQDKTGRHRLTEPYSKSGMTSSDVERIKKLYA
ncbi:astacin-like metalloprotease toxin 5 [Centruroides sculpturatus]|uniref:astacin-like metalloprotease toxin 5 n=1 Tax=Centruroides sculpturatus TaxID=218467 RepID=UPI000C6D666D|nr:astacin-like metalloprotease toxin 5 [Centruroides sculpturatus]